MTDYIAIEKDLLKRIYDFIDDDEFVKGLKFELMERRHNIIMELIPMVYRSTGISVPAPQVLQEDSLEMKDEIPWGPTEWVG